MILYSYLILLAALNIPSSAEAARATNENVEICMGEKVKSWIFWWRTECKGPERKAIVHIPPLTDNGTPTKVPLVINIHALGANGYLQQQFTQFDDVADDEIFVIAYPDGYAKAQVGTLLAAPKQFPLYSFNAGGCCAEACDPSKSKSTPKAPMDDIGFFRELVKHIQEEMPKEHNFVIDPDRIYATGMSNGAFMTNRVECEMSDIVAAVAPVAGPLMNEKAEGTAPFLWGSDPFVCAPKRPVPLMHFHSDNDPIVPYKGSKEFEFPSVDSSIKKWRIVNGVDDAKEVTIYHTDSTTCVSYVPGTSSSVTRCLMESKSHCWPGRDSLGQCGNEIGSEYIWDFFKNHTLSEGFV